MSEKRMGKNWVHMFSTNEDIYIAKSKAERSKYDNIANKMIRHQKKMSAEALVKEATEAYNAKIAAKEKRSKAIAEGRLKAEDTKKVKKKK